MPIQKFNLRTDGRHEGKRLDVVLSEWIPLALGRSLSRSKVRQLIVAGAVYLNGKRVRIASKSVFANAAIEVFVDLEKLLPEKGVAVEGIFEFTPDRILFEDTDLIAVNKPPRLPTQPTVDEARDNLFAALKRFLAERDSIAQPYLGLHHRLDRDTSGVVLFTKTREANSGASRIFSEHYASKVYQAIAGCTAGDRLLQPEWIVRNHLGKVGRQGKKVVYGAVLAGGDFAHTDFRIVERFHRALWVEARPRTGRTHQIRVHLSEAGLPIFGDSLYGQDRSQSAPRLCLHASGLTFPHPLTKTEVSVHCPIPQDFLQCLQLLRDQKKP